MITINVIKVNEIEYLSGKIGKNPYSSKLTPELKSFLVSASKNYNNSKTSKEAASVLTTAFEFVKDLRDVDSNSLVETLKGNLIYNEKTNAYHIVSNKVASVKPVHTFFINKMIEANDKELSCKPWLIFWVRLMRNKLYANSNSKVEQLITYLKTQYVDEENKARLIEKEGYSDQIAKNLSTFDQISITEQGILAAFKYVELLNTKFIVVKNEAGEQVIEEVDRYTKVLEVDEVTGEIIKDELDLPKEAEDFLFQPPIMRRTGDSFSCKDINDTNETPALGHVIKIGRIHELSKGFKQVNTNDDMSGVKGLHVGGYYYVQNFGKKTSFLVDCLVAPEDIGAVCDLYSSDGALRCRRYMVTGGHFAVSKGMYHPSDYASLLDSEWETIKKEVISNLNSQIEEVNKRL
jgi:hypothetical protein